MIDYAALVKICDTEIREGKISAAAARLRVLNVARIPSKWRLPLANLCRRARVVSQGLRLLAPIVRDGKTGSRPGGTPQEIAEYAMLLEKIGGLHEALGLLASIQGPLVPEALFARSACLIGQWEYGEAVGYLESYVRIAPSDYMKLVGQVNLGAALVAIGNTEAAERVLAQAMESSRAQKLSRVFANCLTLRAQLLIQTGDHTGATEDLNEAGRILGMSGTLDQLYTRKWLAIIEAGKKRSIEPLAGVRAEALARGDWATVREADLHGLSIQFDEDVAGRLYFGTPQPAYRRRMSELLSWAPKSSSYRFGSGPAVLAVSDAQIEGLDVSMEAGRQVHRVVCALFRDLYAPSRTGTLFAAIFSDEYFDADSSPVRIRKAIWRARRWIEETGLPLEISEEGGAYSARLHEGLAVELTPEVKPKSLNEDLLSKLALVPGQTFRAPEAAKKLGLSKSSFHRFTQWAIEAGALQKEGSGTSTRYRAKAA